MEFKFLTKWTMPSSYFGATWEEYYEVIGQHRDSDTVTRSNYECMMSLLGGESETVINNRCGHWAVGWVETILIHESDIEALNKAEKALKALHDYPVLDDSHLSELEDREMSEYAKSEAPYVTKFLVALFSLPEEFNENEELLEVAYELNREAQYYGGMDSCFNCNKYSLEKDQDFDTKQLERCLVEMMNNNESYWPKNSAFVFICAALNILQGDV